MKEGGSHKREYIIIDDGSTDNSSCTIRSMTKKLPGKVVHLKRRNMGASFSTNQAVNLANAYWIRLLDGDDLITYKSTEIMLGLAMRFKTEFVYGQMCENDNRIMKKENFNYTIQNEKQGLRKFIRNCPANSSCIFLSKRRYYFSGGCDEAFISPDQVLFLRLFASGKGIFLNKVVALLPKKNEKKGRLSSQIKRSRYESVLALIRFCEENLYYSKDIRKWAFQRALSRSFNYYKYFKKTFFSFHLTDYLFSKIYFPKNYIKIMYRALEVFKNKKNKPHNWQTGSDKAVVSKSRIKL